MKIPRAAWWVLAPLSWPWQYLVYVPGHLIWNLFALVMNPSPGGLYAWSAMMLEPRPRLRPWFIERL